VIDAPVNCTAVVHLPGKRALSCTMKIAATMRGGLSAHVRANNVRCRTCGRRRAAHAAITPRTAALPTDHRNSGARIWCVMPLTQSATQLLIARARRTCPGQLIGVAADAGIESIDKHRMGA